MPQDVSEPATETESNCRTVAFLLLPGMTISCLSAAINVLRLANQLSHSKLYRWLLCGTGDLPLVSAEGFEVAGHQPISGVEPSTLDKLVVCGGQRSQDPKLLRWLKQAAKCCPQIGALGQGSYLLARAGLLDGYRCTTHWDYLPSFQEEYPKLELTPQLYVVDHNRFSCAGGSGVQDLMLHLIRLEQGEELALEISAMQVCSLRSPDELQRGSAGRTRLECAPPSLQEAISLMEANIEEPLQLRELAGLVGISRRQLERLFSKYLNKQPSRFYMEMRLSHARRLLEHTNKSVLEVAVACGFATSPHFSKCIKDQFNFSPRELAMKARRGKDATLASQVPLPAAS